VSSIERYSFSLVFLTVILLGALVGCNRSVPAPVEYKKVVSEKMKTPLPKVRPSGEFGSLQQYSALTPSHKPTAFDNNDGPQSDSFKSIGRTITVRRGDTVYAIARRGKTSMFALIAINGLKPPYRLVIGQTLALPPPQNYTVVKGDTIYAISRRFGIDMLTLVRANGIRRPFIIRVGQRIHVPSLGGSDSLSNVNASVAKSQSMEDVERSFIWPLRGELLSGFGPKGGGLHNDGINIGAELGTIVRAADSGVVAYAGNELRGFGKLLLIRHADSWVTAYAHNSELLVARGDAVKRGQAVSRVGTSGAVQRPQLHFEVRMGIRAIDPMRYLSMENALIQGNVAIAEPLNLQQGPV